MEIVEEEIPQENELQFKVYPSHRPGYVAIKYKADREDNRWRVVRSHHKMHFQWSDWKTNSRFPGQEVRFKEMYIEHQGHRLMIEMNPPLFETRFLPPSLQVPIPGHFYF